MYNALGAVKAPETFDADYYLAIVTVLPILMVAIEVLANFAKSVSSKTQHDLPTPLYVLVSFFYLFCPVIAAIGIVAGVLALMYRRNKCCIPMDYFHMLYGSNCFLGYRVSRLPSRLRSR
jgi:hypothetical protein